MTLLKNLYYSRGHMYSICDNWYKARIQILAEESHNETGHILCIFAKFYACRRISYLGDRGASIQVGNG